MRLPPFARVSSTVIDELAHAADQGDTVEKRALANRALAKFVHEWGFRPMDLAPVTQGIVERVAQSIRQDGLLPEEEINDAYIIAEAALANCALLVSSDAHICGLDPKKLGWPLARCDVRQVLTTSPKKIVKDFFPKR